ncbi:hypothetical protein PMAYCL1PPCAC_31426, partial [Pristionchus mayeri]
NFESPEPESRNVSEVRRVVLFLYSYGSTLGMLIAALAICGRVPRRIRTGAKNVLICLMILTIDMEIGDHFKRITKVAISLEKANGVIALAYLVLLAIALVGSAITYGLLLDGAYDLNDRDTQNIPLYSLIGSYSLVWYSFYALLILLIIFADYTRLLIQTDIFMYLPRRIAAKVARDFFD